MSLLSKSEWFWLCVLLASALLPVWALCLLVVFVLMRDVSARLLLKYKAARAVRATYEPSGPNVVSLRRYRRGRRT